MRRVPERIAGDFSLVQGAAVWRGGGAVVQALLDKGADVPAKDVDGKTALMVAHESNQNEVILLL